VHAPHPARPANRHLPPRRHFPSGRDAYLRRSLQQTQKIQSISMTPLTESPRPTLQLPASGDPIMRTAGAAARAELTDTGEGSVAKRPTRLPQRYVFSQGPPTLQSDTTVPPYSEVEALKLRPLPDSEVAQRDQVSYFGWFTALPSLLFRLFSSANVGFFRWPSCCPYSKTLLLLNTNQVTQERSFEALDSSSRQSFNHPSPALTITCYGSDRIFLTDNGIPSPFSSKD